MCLSMLLYAILLTICLTVLFDIIAESDGWVFELGVFTNQLVVDYFDHLNINKKTNYYLLMQLKVAIITCL